MKHAMTALACLTLLLAATTTQAHDGAEPEWRMYVGGGVGGRILTGDTPAPRLGETTNLTQFGIHAAWAMNPTFMLVADWAYGWRSISYQASGAGSTISNETKATGWNLNGLFAVSTPVGSRGGQLYAGPGFAVIQAEADDKDTNNGTVKQTKRKYGTNMGFAVGAGAIVPFSSQWHGFFSFRHTWVMGQFNQSTEDSSVKAEVPLGGPSAMVGVGFGFWGF